MGQYHDKKRSRMKAHNEMMSAFHAYIEHLHQTIDNVPIEGDPQWNMMLSAFKAGYKAA